MPIQVMSTPVHISNEFLTMEQMKDNANYIWSYLGARGWTKNAVAGMLGNMQTESTINPGLWQNRDAGNTSLGLGLVQWTPATKILDFAAARGKAATNFNLQLDRLQYEIDNNLQWIKTSSYPLSFKQFKVSNQSPEYLAQAFLRNYERPAEKTQPARSTQARFWFNNITGGAGGGEAGCLQLAQFPMDMLLVTQGENGDFSHVDSWAMDFVGTTANYPYYAPCDAECIGRNDSEAILTWKSNGAVMCADGEQREIVWRCIHDDNLLYQTGDFIMKGELMGATGNSGNSSGDHLHLDVWEGTSFTRTNPLHIYDVFSIGGVRVVETKGYPFIESDYADCSNSEGGSKPNQGAEQFISLLLSDCLNGWRL